MKDGTGIRALALASSAALAFVALYAFAAGTAVGRGIDEDILNNALEGTPVDVLANALAHAVNPVTVALAGLAIVCFALARRARVVALAIAVALLGVNASSPLIESLLDDTDPLGGEAARDLGAGFYPSGHTAAMMSIVLAAIALAAPGRPRALTALVGGLLAGAVGVGTVVAVIHHASDVVGGFLLAAVWMAAAVAVVPPAERATPRMPREALSVAALAAVAGVLGAVTAALLDKPAAPVAGAGGVCMIALLLASAFAVLGPRRTTGTAAGTAPVSLHSRPA